MHHWTVHEKVDFPKFPAQLGGVYSTTFATFDPELRTEVKNFPMLDLGGLSTTFATCDPELRIKRFTLIPFMGFRQY